MATIRVTPFPSGQEAQWKIASYSYAQYKAITPADSNVVTLSARLSSGRQVASIRVPIQITLAFCPAIEEMVSTSGIAPQNIGTIIIQVQSHEGAAEILAYLEAYPTLMNHDGRISPFGKVSKKPIYTYFRIAQVAQSLGMTPIAKEAVDQIKGALFKPGQLSWGIAISDLNAIYRNIDDQHWLRYHVNKSIALASINKVLRNEKELKAYITETHSFEAQQIQTIVERA